MIRYHQSASFSDSLKINVIKPLKHLINEQNTKCKVLIPHGKKREKELKNYNEIYEKVKFISIQ